MLTPTLPRRRLRGLVIAAALAAVTLVPASATMAMDAASADMDAAEMDALDTDITSTQTTVTELRALVDDLNFANDALQADKSTLQHSFDSLTLERDRLQDALRHFDDLKVPIEADRQLLFELRKGLPETRPEAEAQLARIRRLALSSNPARLGQLVDRVDDAAPAFLEWRFTQFTSSQAATEAYINSGANAYDSSMDEFRDEVLMSVANRLDGLLTVLDRVR